MSESPSIPLQPDQASPKDKLSKSGAAAAAVPEASAGSELNEKERKAIRLVLDLLDNKGLEYYQPWTLLKELRGLAPEILEAVKSQPGIEAKVLDLRELASAGLQDAEEEKDTDGIKACESILSILDLLHSEQHEAVQSLEHSPVTIEEVRAILKKLSQDLTTKAPIYLGTFVSKLRESGKGISEDSYKEIEEILDTLVQKGELQFSEKESSDAVKVYHIVQEVDRTQSVASAAEDAQAQDFREETVRLTGEATSSQPEAGVSQIDTSFDQFDKGMREKLYSLKELLEGELSKGNRMRGVDEGDAFASKLKSITEGQTLSRFLSNSFSSTESPYREVSQCFNDLREQIKDLFPITYPEGESRGVVNYQAERDILVTLGFDIAFSGDVRQDIDTAPVSNQDEVAQSIGTEQEAETHPSLPEGVTEEMVDDVIKAIRALPPEDQTGFFDVDVLAFLNVSDRKRIMSDTTLTLLPKVFQCLVDRGVVVRKNDDDWYQVLSQDGYVSTVSGNESGDVFSGGSTPESHSSISSLEREVLITPHATERTTSTAISPEHPENQDRTISVPSHGLFAVIDGVGQGKHSHVAAQIVKEYLTGALSKDDIPQDEEGLKAYIKDLLRDISEKIGQEMRRLDTDGAAVLALVKRIGNTNRYLAVNVGDSGIFVVSHNHQGERIFKEEYYTFEEVGQDKVPHQLSGNLFDPERYASFKVFTVEPGTKIAIMSDGVTDNMTDDEIIEAMAASINNEAIASDILNEAEDYSRDRRDHGTRRRAANGETKGKTDDISVVGVYFPNSQLSGDRAQNPVGYSSEGSQSAADNPALESVTNENLKNVTLAQAVSEFVDEFAKSEMISDLFMNTEVRLKLSRRDEFKSIDSDELLKQINLILEELVAQGVIMRKSKEPNGIYYIKRMKEPAMSTHPVETPAIATGDPVLQSVPREVLPQGTTLSLESPLVIAFQADLDRIILLVQSTEYYFTEESEKDFDSLIRRYNNLSPADKKLLSERGGETLVARIDTLLHALEYHAKRADALPLENDIAQSVYNNVIKFRKKILEENTSEMKPKISWLGRLRARVPPLPRIPKMPQITSLFAKKEKPIDPTASGRAPLSESERGPEARASLERLKKGVFTSLDAYRTLPPKQKLLISGALLGVGLAGTALGLGPLAGAAAGLKLGVRVISAAAFGRGVSLSSMAGVDPTLDKESQAFRNKRLMAGVYGTLAAVGILIAGEAASAFVHGVSESAAQPIEASAALTPAEAASVSGPSASAAVAAPPSAPAASVSTTESIIPAAEAPLPPIQVEPGDTLTKILGKDEVLRSLFGNEIDNLTDQGKRNLLANLVDRLQEVGPDKFGIASGHIDALSLTDKLDIEEIKKTLPSLTVDYGNSSKSLLERALEVSQQVTPVLRVKS